MYRAALAALGSGADAEDAAQEAFLLAYRRLNTFRGDASFKTWLLTIAWRQAINRRRRVARLWRLAVRSAGAGHEERSDWEGIPANGHSPEDAAMQAELYRAVRDEIRSLPAKLRDTLLLSQSGDYTYEEIGAMLKAPLGTVKWRVSAARRLVRDRLNRRGYQLGPA